MELLETCKPAAEGGIWGGWDSGGCRVCLYCSPGFPLFLQGVDTGFIS